MFRPDRVGLDHLALAVPDRPTLDRWVQRLDALGIAHSGAIDIPAGAILNFRDPDDIQVSLFWPSN
jgi:catechol-2,3-dioxygenase